MILTIVGIIAGLVSMPPNPVEIPSMYTSIIPVFPTAHRAYIELIAIAFPVAFSLFLVEFFV